MICTVTDYNYLYKFLCLYESLANKQDKKFCEPIWVWKKL